jgi:hypothetical protein
LQWFGKNIFGKKKKAMDVKEIEVIFRAKYVTLYEQFNCLVGKATMLFIAADPTQENVKAAIQAGEEMRQELLNLNQDIVNNNNKRKKLGSPLHYRLSKTISSSHLSSHSFKQYPKGVQLLWEECDPW